LNGSGDQRRRIEIIPLGPLGATATFVIVSPESVRTAAIEEFLVAAGFWTDAFDPDRQRLVDAAVEALVAGLDSPALRELAGLYGDEDWDVVTGLVRMAASELDLPEPSPAKAVRIELANRCRAVLDGVSPPRSVTAWAYDLDGPATAGPRFGALEPFIGIEYEYDYLQDLRDYTDAAGTAEGIEKLDHIVRDQARRIVAAQPRPGAG
jgi:hypothetical protein